MATQPLSRLKMLARIKAWCRLTGHSEREFGYATVQDGRFVERLRLGKGSFATFERAEQFLNEEEARMQHSRARAA